MKNKNKYLSLLLFSLISFPSLAESNSLTSHLDSIVLGSGCFWGAEKGYESINGVDTAISGYSDGFGIKPSYKAITQYKNKYNKNNHAEVVKVTFNSSVVTLESLLQHFFESHDPTQLNRQGNDIGTQYRSIILVKDDRQKVIAQKVLDQFQELLSTEGYGSIQTTIKPLKEFYKAERYHQDYIAKNPNGYCPDHSTGVVFNKLDIQDIDNSSLMAGKQILIINSEGYCPYCEKFEKDVASKYQGTIPLVERTANQLKQLQIETPTWATPTIIFIEDGKEVFSKMGYMEPIDFYKALGWFKLGNTEAFNVAFNEGTDARYCKEYEIFKNTPDGVFIDKLSGMPLFDTKDRFVSKSGWLSFTRPVKDSVYELADNRYGMKRTEIRSKSSDIHLGHVFDDGPNGMPRYCINATVLEFKLRDEILNI
jgi:peptide methionine sulfoxide reductase msrA/msrB|tara:strand:+ start:2399 stop:3670 length:1272 start_codon:yes stop_codon:yes gene_type:complete